MEGRLRPGPVGGRRLFSLAEVRRGQSVRMEVGCLQRVGIPRPGAVRSKTARSGGRQATAPLGVETVLSTPAAGWPRDA